MNKNNIQGDNKKSLIDELPEGWEVFELQDLCQKITDGTHKTPVYQESGVRFISIKNIRPFQPVNWGSYKKYITREAHEELIRRCHPEYDDILFPRIGTLGFAKRIDFNETVSIFVGLGLLKPIKKVILSKYLEYYMNTPFIYGLSHIKATGSGRLTLPLAETRKFPVPLAPIDEQFRIVAEIEKQFSRLDEAIENLKRVKTNLKRYKASVLKAAVEGKLTEEWRKKHPDVEPADKLLKRILAERRKKWEEAELAKMKAKGKLPKDDKWKKRYQEPNSLTIQATLIELPNKWKWVSVDQIGTVGEQSVLTGPFGSNLGKSDFKSSGVPVVTIGCLKEEGISLDKAVYVTEKKANELFRYRLQEGDMLFSRMAAVGRAGFITKKLTGAIFNYHIMRLRLAEKVIDPKYFISFVRGAKAVVDYVREVNHGATRDGINTKQLMAMPVALPPAEEQKQIVLELEQRLTAILEIEKQVSLNLYRADRLRQSILKKAFSGQLVPPVEEYESKTSFDLQMAAESTADYGAKI